MFNQLDSTKRWIGPSLIAILVMTIYQFFMAPVIRDMIDDWTFLHAARIQAIQQQIQVNQKNSEK